MLTKHILYQDQPVQYNITGKGQPVVLVHGFAEDHNVWKYQAEALDDYFQLIMPDLPGSGQSGLINDTSMEGMANVIKAILDAENIQKTTLIGHSMGGYITLAFAEKYPDKLNGFGLFHSTSFADTAAKIASRQKSIGIIEQYGVYAFLKESIPNLFGARFRKQRKDAVTALIEHNKNFNSHSLIAYYKAMMARPDRTHVLEATNLPVLFVIGKEDNSVPYNDSLKICHVPGLSYITVLEYSGHMGMWEQTEEANQSLLQFLNAVTAKP